MKAMIWKTSVLAGALAVGAAIGLPRAQDAKQLTETVQKTVDTHQQTQKQQQAWAEEKSDLAARYRSAKAQVDYLEKKKTFEEKEVSELNEGIAELERRMVESVRLNDSLQDSLNAVVTQLENWVRRDVPFLMEERQERLASVREAIAKPDVTPAEKLRRVLEALQVEANYGNVAEVSQEKIRVGDEDVFADVIRVGRVSVFWRSPDGKRVGEYDRAAKSWVELEGKHVRSINELRDMVLRLKSTKVVSLPLGRIQPKKLTGNPARAVAGRRARRTCARQ
jgi:hypothetical protein